MKTKYTRNELAETVIRALAGGAVMLTLLIAPNAGRMFEVFGKDFLPPGRKNYKREERIRRAVARLKKKRQVEIYERDGKTFVELTQAGKKRLLGYQFDDLTLKKPKRWDLIWRVVIFDIPEKKRRARDALTGKLHELEFLKLQKSVWVTPFPCQDEIDFISELLDIGDCLHYIEARSIDDEAKLQLYFKDILL